MKLTAEKLFAINYKALKGQLVLESDKNTKIRELFVVNDQLVFTSNFGVVRPGLWEKFITFFNGEHYQFINLNPYENKHPFGKVRVVKADGTEDWVEPDYPRGLIDHSGVNYIPFVHQNKYGLLNLYNLYLWEDFSKEPLHFKIDKQFKTKIGKDFKFDLKLDAVGVSTINNQLAVVLSDYQQTAKTQYFSVLEFDKATLTAQWRFVENEMPLALTIDDFPHEKHQKEQGQKPLISDIFWNGKRFTTFTWGAVVRPEKHGYNCSVLFETDTNGRLKNVIYQPKELDYVYFMANTKYIKLTPSLLSKKPYLFNTTTKEEIMVKLPRGYSKYNIFEITEEYVWAEFYDKEDLKVIKCKIES